MKIFIVQDYLRSGGTERQSVLLANAFSAQGHSASLLTFRPGGSVRSSIARSVSQIILQRTDTTLDWYAPGLVKRVRASLPDVVLCMGRMANCYAGTLQKSVPTATVIGSMRTGKNLPWL